DFSRDDVLPSPDNEDKVFNPRILIYEKSVKIITRVTQEKKLAVSFASWLFEDFDPPFYELLIFKEVPNSMRLLPFSSKNKEKVFKPGIYTSKKFHCCFLSELSHPGFGPAWLFDIDSLSQTMNYHPVLAENQTNSNAGFQDLKKSVSPDIHSSSCGDQAREQGDKAVNKDKVSAVELNFTNSTNDFSAVGPSNAAMPNLEDLSHNADDVAQITWNS
nr:hypothetical protein [Tanacetum cinerariifolium]